MYFLSISLYIHYQEYKGRDMTEISMESLSTVDTHPRAQGENLEQQATEYNKISEQEASQSEPGSLGKLASGPSVLPAPVGQRDEVIENTQRRRDLLKSFLLGSPEQREIMKFSGGAVDRVNKFLKPDIPQASHEVVAETWDRATTPLVAGAQSIGGHIASGFNWAGEQGKAIASNPAGYLENMKSSIVNTASSVGSFTVQSAQASPFRSVSTQPAKGVSQMSLSPQMPINPQQVMARLVDLGQGAINAVIAAPMAVKETVGDIVTGARVMITNEVNNAEYKDENFYKPLTPIETAYIKERAEQNKKYAGLSYYERQAKIEQEQKEKADRDLAGIKNANEVAIEITKGANSLREKIHAINVRRGAYDN
jgi:hypothetical protein